MAIIFLTTSSQYHVLFWVQFSKYERNESVCVCVCVCVSIQTYICIYPTPPPWAGCDKVNGGGEEKREKKKKKKKVDPSSSKED